MLWSDVSVLIVPLREFRLIDDVNQHDAIMLRGWWWMSDAVLWLLRSENGRA